MKWICSNCGAFHKVNSSIHFCCSGTAVLPLSVWKAYQNWQQSNGRAENESVLGTIENIFQYNLTPIDERENFICLMRFQAGLPICKETAIAQPPLLFDHQYRNCYHPGRDILSQLPIFPYSGIAIRVHIYKSIRQLPVEIQEVLIESIFQIVLDGLDNENYTPHNSPRQETFSDPDLCPDFWNTDCEADGVLNQNKLSNSNPQLELTI